MAQHLACRAKALIFCACQKWSRDFCSLRGRKYTIEGTLADERTSARFGRPRAGLLPSRARSAARSAASSRSRPALEPEPPLVIVMDLQGDCTAAFGALEEQTPEKTRALIEAALDASERLR